MWNDILASEDVSKITIYAIVFIAVCLPIACWRRESVAAAEIPRGDWSRLPLVFKLLWRPAALLETTVGAFFSAAFGKQSMRYRKLAEISALPLTSRRVFVCKAVCAPLFAIAGSTAYLVPSIPGPVSNIAVAGFAVFGWMLPSLALDSVARSRQEEIVKSLPFAIDLMGSAMKSGLDFGAAMRYYTKLGNGGALESEFSRVLRDASLGKPIAESLQDMAGRVSIKTFTAFAGVVAYGTEIGASISDTLKVHGAEMRRERFSLAEQKAARAPSVMIFPLAIFIMPAVFLIIFVPVILQFLSTQSN